MAIIESYEVQCDRCTYELRRSNGIRASQPTRERIADAALRAGWSREDDAFYCPECAAVRAGKDVEQ